jgi:hypothetical protein
MTTINTDPAAPRYCTLDDMCRSPAPSQASRVPSRRSKGSSRALDVGGSSPREIHCESGMEADFLTVMLARRDVVDVQEQPPTVTYIDEDGCQSDHTFDFLVEMQDGRKIVYEVKPFARAVKHRWRDRIALIASQDEGFADGYALVTEKNFPRDVVHNAELIRSVRRNGPEYDDCIREIVFSVRGRVKIGDIVARSGLDGDGFRAVVRLIDAGELKLVGGGRIDYPAFVVRSGGSMTSAAA